VNPATRGRTAHGFSLLEAVLALALVGAAVLVAAGGLRSENRLLRSAEHRNEAARVLEAAIESVRSGVLLAFRTARSGAESLQRERRLVELRAATDAALAATLATLDESPTFHLSRFTIPSRCRRASPMIR